MATVPNLQWKYMTEGNPFGRKIMTNVAEVVAWMAANFDGDKEKIPSLKYLTAGKTLCERQIANLSEVVQAMFDNWGDSMYTEVDTTQDPVEGTSYFIKDENEKYVPGGLTEQGEWDTKADKIYTVAEGVIAPVYAYATETTKPLAILYIENMPKVVGEMYKQMFPENWTEEDEFYFTDGASTAAVQEENGDSGNNSGDNQNKTTADDEYEEVDKSAVDPDPNTTYYVKNDQDEYVEGGVENGQWISDVTVYTKKSTEPVVEPPQDQDDTPTYTYTQVDKSEVTQPVEGVTYYISDGEGGYVEGGVDEDTGEWTDDDVFTRDEPQVTP